MATRLIPERFRPGLIAIANLSDEAASELVGVLQAEQAALLEADLIDFLTSTLKHIPSGDVEEIVPTLIWLCAGRSVLEEGSSAVADLVSHSSELTEIGDEQRELLSARLVQLIETDAITVTWKATDVLTENEKNFYEARIVTDIRPIFGHDVTQPPSSAVIIHLLRLHYHRGSHHEELFLALNPADIKELRAVLERAERKEESLKTMLATAGLTYLARREDT